MEPNVEILFAENSTDRRGNPGPVPVFWNWLESGIKCDTLRPVFEMIILKEREALEVCEIVWSICNSSPGEMHCAQQYLPEVTAYREAGNRSLSVGDVIRLNENYYMVDNTGFQVIGPETVNRRRVEIAA